jgi:hypothetical protein
VLRDNKGRVVKSVLVFARILGSPYLASLPDPRGQTNTQLPLEKCMPPVYLPLCCKYLKGFYEIVTNSAFRASGLTSQGINAMLLKATENHDPRGVAVCHVLIQRVEKNHQIHLRTGQNERGND